MPAARCDVKNFRSGSLLASVDRVTGKALGSGALVPIATEQRWIEQGGVRFLVRVVSSLARKQRERTEHSDTSVKPDNPVDPFLPYDPALLVADVSDTHVCLLNRFNVIDRHLLIVTRAFEDQETLLTAADFEALSRCMAEIDGLAFFNGGAVAGASQPHKHLQLVPLPMADVGPNVPIETLLAAAESDRTVTRVPGLAFRHAFARLDAALLLDPPAAAEAMRGRYHALLNAAGLDIVGRETRQSAPYNLLITHGWMLLVPRSNECFQTISVNALGFAGSLFVRDARQLQTVQHHGPMTVLRRVAVA
jgi:sulfate adenylyltransferase (ADP) / ATP adenylyltransferase